jgi:transposase
MVAGTLGSLHKAGSKKMTETTTVTAGIDTSKDKLDVAVHGLGVRLAVQNQLAGWKKLAAEFAQLGVTRIGIEATGGYERGVVRHLQGRGFTVLVLQPLQAKAYARLHLRRAKSDRIDAVLIAACAHVLKAPGTQSNAALDALTDHLTFIEQVEEDIARFKTRIEHIHDKRLRGLVTNDIKRLETLRTNELRRISDQLRKHDDLAKRCDLVLSVPGIGERTAIALVLRMPELGRISREQATALAGLAPFDDDSGQHKGQRHIAGGRSRLRRSLYAASLAAAFRWNPALKALYQRIRANGKPHKVALIACARKLLIFANAVIQRGTPWTPIHIHP